MTEVSGSKPTVVVITSFFPFRGAEAYAGQELVALKKAGVNLILIPRSITGPVLGSDAASLLDNTLLVPLINGPILLALVGVLVSRPRLALDILSWLIRRSNTPLDFIKGIVVVPKALYLGRRLAHAAVYHVCAHQVTSVADIGYILSTMLRVPWSGVLHSPSAATAKRRRALGSLLASMHFLRTIDALAIARLNHLFDGRYRDKLITIHHGVRCDFASPHEARGPSPERLEILTVAALREFKGLRYALEAAKALLRQDVTNFRWRLVGDGPLRASLTLRLRELGLTQHVQLVGAIPNDKLLEMYARHDIDIFIMTSATDRAGQTEGIAHALKEAMAYGLPVIATDTGSTRELVIDGKTGLLVPEKDPEAIAKALEYFIRNPEARREYGARGREYVESDYNLSRILPTLQRVFSGGPTSLAEGVLERQRS
jgi:colanic acid/amylovoran biosynthesis glycosyltransferase